MLLSGKIGPMYGLIVFDFLNVSFDFCERLSMEITNQNQCKIQESRLNIICFPATLAQFQLSRKALPGPVCTIGCFG